MTAMPASIRLATLAMLAACTQAWGQGAPQQTPAAAAQPAAAPQQSAAPQQPAAPQQGAAASPLGPDNGFFRPSYDVSLTNPRPPAAATRYETLQSSSADTAPAPAPAAAPAPNTVDVMRWTEQQMDRSERQSLQEGQRMQAAPAGVGAAWDGTTSERDR